MKWYSVTLTVRVSVQTKNVTVKSFQGGVSFVIGGELLYRCINVVEQHTQHEEHVAQTNTDNRTAGYYTSEAKFFCILS